MEAIKISQESLDKFKYEKKFYLAIDNCRDILTNALMEFVKECGEEISQIERQDFDLEDDEYTRITKIYNFTEKDGCYYNVSRSRFQDIDPYNYETIEGLADKMDDEFCHNTVSCLYIEEDRNTGEETLKYYMFYNSGTYFSEGLSEPEHGDVYDLGLEDLSIIFGTIIYTENKK